MTAVFSAATLTSSVVRMAENVTISNALVLLASLGGQEISLASFFSRMLGHRIYMQLPALFQRLPQCMSLLLCM